MKQALIDKEILEKGYAPQDFEYYLQKMKCKRLTDYRYIADSHDLKKWGLSELKGVIMEF